jgi:hypothetical protein
VGFAFKNLKQEQSSGHTEASRVNKAGACSSALRLLLAGF